MLLLLGLEFDSWPHFEKKKKNIEKSRNMNLNVCPYPCVSGPSRIRTTPVYELPSVSNPSSCDLDDSESLLPFFHDISAILLFSMFNSLWKSENDICCAISPLIVLISSSNNHSRRCF